jgi:hypothetical protein
MKKPNFFIVGAAKAGTSSLWGYLNEHPEIFMSQKKEPGFFCDQWPGPKDIERYFTLFEEATESHNRVGEASTCYLSCPHTAANLARYCEAHGISHPKIIVVLRNPVDRAYSLYNWQVQEGYEYAGSFEKAVALEESRKQLTFPHGGLTGGYKYNYLYYHSGLYHDQLVEYFEAFGREHIHVEIFEEFVKQTEARLTRIYRFLELENRHFLPELTVYNPSYDVVAPWLQFSLRKINQAVIERRPMRKLIKSKAQRDLLLNLGLKKQKPPRIDPQVREQLLARYRPEIERLEVLLGRDLSFWLASQSTAKYV